MADFIETYILNLEAQLLEKCTSLKKLDGQLLDVEELNEKWTKAAPAYMADAVPQFNDYPAAAIAWACYMGMGSAYLWDRSWEEYEEVEDWYDLFAAPRGFDCMDEYILEEIMDLGLGTSEVDELGRTILSCTQIAINLMRKENIEAQSTDAFYIFARTEELFFKLGVALGLKRLGYKYVKMDASQLC